MKWMGCAAVLVAFALAAGCTLKEDPATKGGNDGPPPIPAPADVAAPPADAIKMPSGLAYKVLTVGLGSIHPSPRSVVVAHYTGWTADGKMFESSYLSQKPIQMGLIRGNLIEGWYEMLQLMVVGQKVRVWIPPGLAYEKMPDRPQGMLVFEIELLDIK